MGRKNHRMLPGAGWGRAVRLPRASPNIALEPTPNSLRSYVASAIGRGSPRALGIVTLNIQVNT
jgi:hypothetical protein